ncbi:MAG: peptidylprolyl isomerase [Betaproteobacteria bacterium]
MIAISTALYVTGRRATLASVLAVSALAPASLWAQAQGAASAEALSRPFVTINGEAQSVARAEVLLREQLARGAANSPQLQSAVRDALVNQALMAQAATKEGLDKLPLVQAQIELARQSVLMQAWQQQLAQSKEITDDELRQEYDRQVKLLGSRQFRLRHLLVNEEATAKLLLDRVKAGGKIADLAAEYSLDEATRSAGGLTDWMAQGEMVPALLKAVESLKAGQLASAPVRGLAGWHVLALEDARAFTPPARDTLKPQLQRAVIQQRLQAALEKMRETAKVE